MSKDEEQTKKPANNNNNDWPNSNLKIRKGGIGAVARQLMGLPPMQPNPMHGSGKFIGPWGGPMPPGLGLVAAEMMGLQAQPPKQQNTQMGIGPALGLMSSQGQMLRMPMKGGGFGPGYDPWRSLQINTEVQDKRKSA